MAIGYPIDRYHLPEAPFSVAHPELVKLQSRLIQPIEDDNEHFEFTQTGICESGATGQWSATSKIDEQIALATAAPKPVPFQPIQQPKPVAVPIQKTQRSTTPTQPTNTSIGSVGAQTAGFNAAAKTV